MNWYIDAFRKKYADFDGRAHRTEFWMFILFHVIVAVVLIALSAVSEIFIFVYIIYLLVAILPLLAVGARRLHDTNRTGWWQLIQFIPLGIIVLIVFWAMDGDAEPNAHGPNPWGTSTTP